MQEPAAPRVGILGCFETLIALQAQQGLDLQIRVLAQALPFPNNSLSSSRVFFRRHYPLAAIRFCGMDPENRK